MILDLSCGIGTRAKQRDSSSCENMCISYKYRVFHPDAYLEAMEVKISDHVAMQNTYDRVTLHLLSTPPSLWPTPSEALREASEPKFSLNNTRRDIFGPQAYRNAPFFLKVFWPLVS